jgi:hypothetical protein
MQKKLCILGIANLLSLISTLYTMEQPVVIACDFNVLSQNADTGHIIEHALSSAKHIFSCLNWKSLFALPATVKHMQQRGLEIAEKTPGITNTIKTLFAELERQGYGKFTDTAITCFNEMGINPVVDRESLALLQQLHELNIPTIGMGSQDSLEHEIYASKMLSDHKVDVHELYSSVVTIPTLEERQQFELGAGDYFVRKQKSPRWFVTPHTNPSQAFIQTLKILAHDVAGDAPLWSINSKEQLILIVQTLRKVFEHRSPSPESSMMFERIIDESPLMLSPTRV